MEPRERTAEQSASGEKSRHTGPSQVWDGGKATYGSRWFKNRGWNVPLTPSMPTLPVGHVALRNSWPWRWARHLLPGLLHTSCSRTGFRDSSEEYRGDGAFLPPSVSGHWPGCSVLPRLWMPTRQGSAGQKPAPPQESPLTHTRLSGTCPQHTPSITIWLSQLLASEKNGGK